MRRAPLWMVLAWPAASTWAQHAEHGAPEAERDARAAPAVVHQHPGEPAVDPHAGHDAQAGPDAPADHDAHAPTDQRGEDSGSVPEEAFSGPVHAADSVFGAAEMGAARELLRVEHGGFRTQMLLADRFEARAGDGGERVVWDLQGWYGGDLHKLWWKSEGAGDFGANPDDAEAQMLYSRAVTPFFDFQAGIRHDFEPSPRRSHAVLGVQGLLPYVFEIAAAAFVSDEGDVTGRVEAEYDLRIRQRLVLQPRVELSFSAQ